MRGSAWLVAGCLTLCAPLAGRADEALTQAGAALFSALDDSEREAASWAFEDSEREDVHYAPFFLDGVSRSELAPAADARTEELLRAALSERGYATLRAIRELERDVRVKEQDRFWSFLTRRTRDPNRYLLALFGEPAAQAAWGFRYEGHHVSLNVTAAPGAPPATTPLFLGAEPRRVPQGWPSAGVAVLGEEERIARELHASLPDALRRRATLAYEDGRALMLGQAPRVTPGAAVGVSRAEMPGEQAALLDALVERFFGVFPPRVSREHRARLDASGRDALRFAFVASDAPPDAFYVRVQGPNLLIEIDNTTDGDHVHAVWHDLANDFGDDVLARHLREEHGLHLAERALQ